MLKYNLCLIRQGDKVLLLNRNKAWWMGCWNGVGGKLEPQETARASMLREIEEETGITDIDVHFKGLITWSTVEGNGFGGLYLYTADLARDYAYPTPVRTNEGILEWKEMEWIMHPENIGVAYNLPKSMALAFGDNRCFDHHSIFAGNHLVKQIATEIDPGIEGDSRARTKYLAKYLKHIS